ncbi:MAG: hypothetical protein H6617_04045 [Bdellovibrionaceae bacterium]|nr:hypothetical protein [Bdellovibrionales bacterium]MCB9253830.1 hypothetical protein [Pseudobdellovibrionaceae bacterium]
MKEKARAHVRSKKPKSVYQSPKKKSKTPTLKQLIRQKDIATFLKFVDFYGLRAEALKAINERIADA